MQGTKRVASAQTGSLHHIVVCSAEETVLPKRKFVPRDELAAAGHTAETLDVIHLGAGTHHEVVLAEADAALGAFDPVQPVRGGVGGGPERGEKHRKRGSLQAGTSLAQDPGQDAPSKQHFQTEVGNRRTEMKPCSLPPCLSSFPHLSFPLPPSSLLLPFPFR